jgi:hypothetical protein
VNLCPGDYLSHSIWTQGCTILASHVASCNCVPCSLRHARCHNFPTSGFHCSHHWLNACLPRLSVAFHLSPLALSCLPFKAGPYPGTRPWCSGGGRGALALHQCLHPLATYRDSSRLPLCSEALFRMALVSCVLITRRASSP